MDNCCELKKLKTIDSGVADLKKVESVINSNSNSNGVNDDSNIGNESDSDADYDDLDDIALPSDNDDFIDDDVEPDEDDKSVHSTATTISDSSACSNTPSLIGESLETSSSNTQDTKPRKLAWVSSSVNCQNTEENILQFRIIECPDVLILIFTSPSLGCRQ